MDKGIVSLDKIKLTKKCKWTGHFVPIILIIMFCTYYMDNNMIIKIVGDEYGYWSAGAFFSGYDWSQITSYNPYYSYGYGLWLAIILSLNLSSVTSYRIALGLNIFFLCGIYFIVYKIVEEYIPNTSRLLSMSMAFMVATYTGNFYYTQYTMSEVLISFVYWSVVYLATKLLEKASTKRVVMYILLVEYLLFVHQRTLGVFVVSALFLCYIFYCHRIEFKRIFIYIIFAFTIMAILLWVKKCYQFSFFGGGEGINLAGNDFSGQVSKIQYILSFHGLWMFIKAYVGKIFYALSSTNLLVGISVILIFVKIIEVVKKRINKKKKIDNQTIMLLYILLNAVAMMAIGSIFMIDYYARFDLIIYGRYFDFTMGPLMLVALLFIVFGTKKTVYYCVPILVGGYIIITILINQVLIYQTNFSNMFINCPGIADTMIFFGYKADTLFLVAIKAVFVLAILLVLVKICKKNYKLISVVLIMFAVVSMISDLYVYKEGCLRWSIEQNKGEINLANYVYQKDISNNLYYYVGDSVLDADYLQFVLKESSIKSFWQVEEIENFSAGDYILTSKTSEITNILENLGYEVVSKSGTLDLWGRNH